MNSPYEPYVILAQYREVIDYGKHASGRVKCGPAMHEARHRAIEART